jgi:hypothetical protein
MSVKVESYNKKYLKMKPEVSQIFSDLEDWHSYCRFKLIKYDPADLYKSDAYKLFIKRRKEWLKEKESKR